MKWGIGRKEKLAGRENRAQCLIFFCLGSLFTGYITEIIPKIAFGKRHDPGQIAYVTQKTEGNITVQDKQTKSFPK